MWPFRKTAPSPRDDGVAPTPAPTPEAIAPHRTAFILIGLGGAAVASFGIAAISSIFTAAFFGLVLTICVYPVRRWLESRGVPRGVGTVAVLVAVVALLGAFVGTLIIAVGQFLTLLPQYQPQMEAWFADVGDWLESFGIGAEQVAALLSSFHPENVLAYLGSIAGSAAGLVSSAVVLLTLLILMAADSSYSGTIGVGIRERRPALGAALARFTWGVRRYMVVTTGLGAAQGLINWLALVLMGIPGALLWGLLSFLCSFIPNIGYFIAIVPPIVFGALTGGWPLVVGVIVVYGVINGVIQSIIQPRVVGGAVSLSQTITFVSVLFWAVVLGPMGAILAVPLTLLVRMLLVDSNPKLTWIQPALGDLDATKQTMAAQDAAAKSARRAARDERRGAAQDGRSG